MTDTQALSVNTRRPLGPPSPPVRVTDRRSFLTAQRRPPAPRRQPLHPPPTPPANDSFVRFCPAATPPPTTGFIIIFFFFFSLFVLLCLITALHTHARAHTRTQNITPHARASRPFWLRVNKSIPSIRYCLFCVILWYRRYSYLIIIQIIKYHWQKVPIHY